MRGLISRRRLRAVVALAIGAALLAACDTTPPSASVASPVNSSTLSGTVVVSAIANDDTGVVGVQFMLDGNNVGVEDTTLPYSVSWDTTTASNGPHTLTARARDTAGNKTTSSAAAL